MVFYATATHIVISLRNSNGGCLRYADAIGAFLHDILKFLEHVMLLISLQGAFGYIERARGVERVWILGVGVE